MISNLFDESTSNLNDLITVITAGKLRMSDDERLKMIDHIYSEVGEQYAFLHNFTSGTAMLSIEREKEKQEVETSRKLFAIK